MKRAVFVLACLLVALAIAAPSSAKSYSADRFDSRIRVLPDGTLDVTETVVFRFEEGTFREVFRDVPLRRTDGIDVVRAEMDGRPLPVGREPGTVEIEKRSSRIRIVWRFAPTEGTTREFVLNYRVRGAVRRDDTADLLVWRATPGEHRYRIASSTIEFELPVAPLAAPEITSRKADTPRLTFAGFSARIQAGPLRENGWIEASLRFPRGAVASTPPAWQRHAADIAARSPTWIVAAAVVFAAGLVLLFAWRQSYDTPPAETEFERADWHQSATPDLLTPTISGVVASNGRATLEHAMATLYSLADRREIDIQEKPRGMLGQRDFILTRRGEAASLAGYERLVLDLAFKNGARHNATGATVLLSQARSRLMRGQRKFAAEINRELASAGLLDAGRKAIRDRYNKAAIVLLIAAGLAAVPAAPFVTQQGPWPFLISASLVLLALAAAIFAASTSPLSNDGVRRGAQWRQYRKHLRAIAQDKRPSAGLSPTAVLPYAVALGLAGAWSKFMKAHNHAAPAWFHALPSSQDAGAFAAFVATGGAGATSGHGGGAGAAGGGASGAH